MPIYFESLMPAARSAIGGRGQFVMAVAQVSTTKLLACCRDRFGSIDLWMSNDDGLTWQACTHHGDRLVGERVAILDAGGDGVVYLDVCRRYRSIDEGATWHEESSRAHDRGVDAGGESPSGIDCAAFLESGETDPHLLMLRDGRLLCTYARHESPLGIFAVVSEDGGRTWDTDHPVFLAGSWPDMFGSPTSIELADGTILTAHCIRAYHETDKWGDSVTHALRWRLAGDSRLPVTPATQPVLPDPPDWEKYSYAGTGFTGDLQQIAYWEKSVCQRVRIADHYKGALGRFSDGELLVTPMHDGECKIYRSMDEGRSWQAVPMTGATLIGKEQAMLCLADGRTVLFTSQCSRDPGRKHDSMFFRSTDRGCTWEEIHCGAGSTSYRRDVVCLSDGTILLFNSTGDNRESEGSAATEAWRMRSHDGGATWQRDAVHGAWNRSRPFFTEAAFLGLTDQRLLMASRINGDHVQALTGADPPMGLGWHNAEVNQAMAFMTSDDGGLSWSEPWVVLDYSDVHARLLRLDDGRILCSYRCRSRLPFGIRAVLSDDEGRTWDLAHPILLGAHTTYYGGWQTDLQLPDGTMITTWAWAYDGPDTFEVIRWRLPGMERGASNG